MALANKENFFDLFGFEQKFQLSEKQLEQKYFELQRKYHPDRFVGKPDRERIEAAQKSVTINEGYKTLKDPLKRAEYLLSLAGKVVNAEKGGEKPDQEILTEAMEYREKLMEAEDREDFMALEKVTLENKAECMRSLENAFVKGEIEKAVKEAIRLKYIYKFEEELRRGNK